MEYNGERFLDVLYVQLYKSEEVLHTKENKDTKEESIRRYMDRLESIHNKSNTKSKKDLVKHLYFNKYVIKEENMPWYMDDNERQGIIEAQKKTLGAWIDYLTDENAKYPMWAKYWVFQQMLKMGTYDEISSKYTKRTKNTMKPFIEANPEIIAKCIGNLTALLGNEKLSMQQIRKLVSNISFEKMYIEYQKNRKEQHKSNEGIWIKYNQGSTKDAKRLAASLEDKNTGWCTADEFTAIEQLCGGSGYRGGDFYVYYTKDEEGNYKIPRIAIRMENNSIKEIRGIAEHQNLEEEMIPILESKLKEMSFLEKSDIDENIEKINKLKYLVTIKDKTLNNIPLTHQEVTDLYFGKYGFGWGQDPLVVKIIQKRNFIEDYNTLNKNPKESSEFIIKNIDLLEKLNVNRFLKDKNVILPVSKIASKILKYVDEELLQDKTFVLEMVKQNGLALQYVNEKVKYDREVILEATKSNGHVINFLGDFIENDREIIEVATKTYPQALDHASMDIKKDKEFVKKLIPISVTSLRYADPNVRDDKEIILEAIKYSRANQYTKFNILSIASKRLRDDKEVVLASVKMNGYSLENASSRLKDNVEVVLEAIKEEPQAITYASKRLKENKYIIIKCIKTLTSEGLHINSIQNLIPNEFLNDKDVVVELVKNNGWLIRFASNDLKEDRDVAKEAVRSDGYSLLSVSKKLQYDEEIVLEAIKNDYRIIFILKDIKKYIDFKKYFDIIFPYIEKRAFEYIENHSFSNKLENDKKDELLDEEKSLKEMLDNDERYVLKIEDLYRKLRIARGLENNKTKK